MPTETSQAGHDFRVRRDALDVVEIAPLPAPADVEPQDGEIVLAVDAFSFTANNVTYGLRRRLPLLGLLPRPRGLGAHPGLGVRRRRALTV